MFGLGKKGLSTDEAGIKASSVNVENVLQKPFTTVDDYIAFWSAMETEDKSTKFFAMLAQRLLANEKHEKGKQFDSSGALSTPPRLSAETCCRPSCCCCSADCCSPLATTHPPTHQPPLPSGMTATPDNHTPHSHPSFTPNVRFRSVIWPRPWHQPLATAVAVWGEVFCMCDSQSGVRQSVGSPCAPCAIYALTVRITEDYFYCALQASPTRQC